tara:strand:- start:447 stop:668 length:222 start_codon:yes stop_codon:yes gene_type:complete
MQKTLTNSKLLVNNPEVNAVDANPKKHQKVKAVAEAVVEAVAEVYPDVVHAVKAPRRNHPSADVRARLLANIL